MITYSEMLDEDHDINPAYIAKRGWVSLLFPDVVDKKVAASLYKAIADYKPDKLIGIHYEYGRDAKQDIIPYTKNIFKKIYYDYADSFLIVTDKNIDFLFYKDQNTEYYLVAGEINFIVKIFSGNKAQLKDQYFSWFSPDALTSGGVKYYWEIWEKYRGTLPPE